VLQKVFKMIKKNVFFLFLSFQFTQNSNVLDKYCITNGIMFSAKESLGNVLSHFGEKKVIFITLPCRWKNFAEIIPVFLEYFSTIFQHFKKIS